MKRISILASVVIVLLLTSCTADDEQLLQSETRKIHPKQFDAAMLRENAIIDSSSFAMDSVVSPIDLIDPPTKPPTRP
ncbi:hypothetical protein [Flavobacterium pedocola]